MRAILLIILSNIIIFTISAQQLKGIITTSNNTPIPNATVYIQEIALGLVADEQGEFQVSLDAGDYTFIISSLGYERKTIPVTIGKEDIISTFKLEPKTYTLQEVKVSANREDPAYAIMRKAISMAPFYLHQIKSYESEVYLKGTVKVEKIPKYIKKMAKDPKLDNMTGKLFLLESQNEVSFKAPNNYEQKVIAYNSSIPSDVDMGDAMEMITVNVYEPDAFGRISPLSAGSFSYYKFFLEGMTTEGEHIVNKIRVEPKKKNPKLVTGWLYIIENSWNVQRVDLSATEFGITVRVTAMFNEVKPYAFLPTSYDIDMNVSLMGVKASGKYYSSVKYNQVELNEVQGVVRKKQTQPITPVIEKTKNKKQIKAEEQLKALSEKDELTTREAYKLSKLMEEATEPENKKAQRESLELLSDDKQIKIRVDSMARYRDSTYWEEVRNLPLRKEEIISYQIKDSLKQVNGSLLNEEGEWVIGSSDKWSGVFTGGTQRLGNKVRLSYSGLLRAVPEYNFVDGFWVGQRFNLDLLFKNKISISPAIYYTTARKSVNWQIDGKLSYAKERNGSFYLAGGDITTDFNRDEGTLRLINTISSLFFAENPIKFYRKKFIEAGNEIELSNGLFLNTLFIYEDRYHLENRQSYSFFGGRPEENQPDDQIPMPNHSVSKIRIGLEYTPKYYYHRFGNRKEYAHSSYPTFSFRYERGYASLKERSGWFDRIEAGVDQKIKLNAFHNLSYRINGGKFVSPDNVYFPDFKHFTKNDLFISGNTLETSFNFINNYSYSTNKQWIQAHLNYNSKYLLIKNISFLQPYIFDESLHGKTIWIPGKNYTEFGYSLGFTDIARIGIFIGLEKGRYDTVGFTIGLPILRGLGVK